MKRRPKFLTIFAVPAMICGVSLIGLISALTGDGLRDVIAWAMLALPVIVVIRAMADSRS